MEGPSFQQVPLNSAYRFAHIDALRAFSVTIVVVAHSGLGYVVPGGSGVTIFFTISGFIITLLLIKEKERTGRFSIYGFYERRAVKIFPPLLVLIIIPGVIWNLMREGEWGGLVAQVLFAFNWLKAQGGSDVLPGSGVVWSLSVEEQFYIVWAVLWLFLARRVNYLKATVIVAASTATLSLLLRIVYFALEVPVSRIYYGTDTRIEGIAIGVLCAVFVTRSLTDRPRWMNPWTESSVLLTAVAIFFLSLLFREEWFRYTFRFTLQSLSAAIVISYGLLASSSRLRTVFDLIATNRVVSYIGLSSYSIYLVHYPLIIGFRSIVRGDSTSWLLIVACVAMSIAAGCLIYRWLEVPIQRWHKARRWRADSAKSG